ncbi:hypothetical protein FOL46_000828 [Perkinsus olseni]|uniref:Piezo non-specific cation channel R-Ras-binding domain-containing protein n=1 Tax=Perkinsus olseni TaxID=32597 RepID=A0A7J6MW19_PEROL|nr:hypothetical protein FOL46_000828 [Perkinsus olseni]
MLPLRSPIPPLLGLAVFAMVIAVSCTEDSTVPGIGYDAQAVMLALQGGLYSTTYASIYFGSSKIGWYVVGGLILALLLPDCFDLYPLALQKLSLPLSSVPPLARTIITFLLMTWQILLSPCLLTLPYIPLLFLGLHVWAMPKSRASSVHKASKRNLMITILAYAWCQGFTMYVLSLPAAVASTMNTTLWVPQMIGSPMVKEYKSVNPPGFQMNFSVMLFSVAGLVLQATLLPWFIQPYEPLTKQWFLLPTLRHTSVEMSTPRPSREGRSFPTPSTSTSSERSPSILTHRVRKASAADHDDEDVLSAAENGHASCGGMEKKKRPWVVRAWTAFLDTIALSVGAPLILICWAVVIPSTLATPLQIAGCGLLILPNLVGTKVVFGVIVCYAAFLTVLNIVCSIPWTFAQEVSTSRHTFFLKSVGFHFYDFGDGSQVGWRFLAISLQFLLTCILAAIWQWHFSSAKRARDEYSHHEEEPIFPKWMKGPTAQYVWKTVRRVLTHADFAVVCILIIVMIVLAVSRESNVFILIYLFFALVLIVQPEGIIKQLVTQALILSSVVCCAVSMEYAIWNYSTFSLDPFPTVFVPAIAHLCIFLVAILPNRLPPAHDLHRASTPIGAFLREHWTAISRVAVYIALFWTLWVALTKPVDVFSIVMLAIFVVQVAIYQLLFKNSERYLGIIVVNYALAYFCIAVVGWRCVALYPSIYEELTTSVAYPLSSELGIDKTAAGIWKTTLTAFSAVVCMRMVRFASSLLMLDDLDQADESDVDLSRDPRSLGMRVFESIVIYAARILPSVVMYCIFLFSAFETSLASVVLMIAAAVILCVGRGWGTLNVVVSLAVSVFFILQYAFRFSFAENSILADTEQWLGFSWTGASVGRNIGILILCVVQRNIDYTARYGLSPWGRKPLEISSSSLAFYTPAIAACALMITAAARSNVYSYIYYAMAASLMSAMKHGSSPRLPRLVITSLVLVLCVIVQLLLRLWYPPWCSDCPPRYDGGWLCGSPLIAADGAYTASCEDDWQRFFVAPGSLHGYTALNFYREVPSSITVMGPIPGAALIWELSCLWIIVMLIRNIRIGLNRGPPRGSSSMLTRQNAALTLGRTAKSGSRSSGKWPLLGMRLWIYVLWLLTFLSSFAYTMETNVMTDVMLCMFIGLLRFHFDLKAARRHMVVITMCAAATIFGLQLFYQIPFIPCRVWQDACNPHAVVDGTARVSYISCATCVHLQDVYQDNRDRCGALVEHDVFTWLQIFFQVIGFGKSHGGITLPFPFGFGPALLALCAGVIQLRIYDNPGYDVIESEYIHEIRSRKGKARRFVNEFNANLFILSRQATCTIGGIAAKLRRVREKVDTFVDINQKGFDVTVTTRLAAENRLSIGRNRLDLLEQGGSKAGFQEVETMETEQLRIDGFSDFESRRALEICHNHPHEAQALLSDARRFGLGKMQESQVLMNYSERQKEAFEEEPPGLLASVWQWVIQRLENGTNSVRFLEDYRAADPQTLHTRAGGLAAVAAKYLASSTAFPVYLFIVLDFLVATSIFDAVRVIFALWFVPRWPLQPRWVWEVLIVATAIWFVLRMAYQTPLFCAAASTDSNFGIFWRFGSGAASPVYFEGGYGNPRMSTVSSCPKYVDVGWDVWIGIAKVTGESALPKQRSTGLIGYVWADALLLLALYFHKWSLQLCGLWEFVQVADPRDEQAAILVPREGLGLLSSDSLDDVETERDPLSEHSSETGGQSDSIANTMLVRGNTVYQSISSSSASDSDYASAVSTTIASFVDIYGMPLISVGYAELSRYATSRYMCNEDVQGRCVPAWSEDLASVSRLLDGYRRMRWLSQRVYANNETLRFPHTEEGHSLGSASTDWLGRIYYYLDPFAAHKVGHDYYITLFLLALFLWIWCILTYHQMSGDSGEDVLGVLKSNKFSASLAVLMISHLVLIVLDRAYYRASCMNDTGTIDVDLSQADTPFTADDAASGTATVESCRMSVRRKTTRVAMGWFIFRVILLLAIVLALHITILVNLVPHGDASAFTPVIQNWAMSIYYMVFVLYLVVSLKQLRDGVPRVWRDSLRPAKSWNAVRNTFAGYAFSAYKVIPFLQEVRTTVDWAVTPTSLDLSQYFLLEDAHNNFWDVSQEMDDRRENWPAERKKFWWEKCMSGCCLTVILVIIIVLPILIFSTFSPFSKNAYVTEASMKVSLNIQSCGSDCESPYYIFQDLYSSPILHSVQITGSAATKFLQTQPGVSTDAAVQNITFPLGSSTVIQASPNRIRSITDLIGPDVLDENLRLELKLAVSWSRSNSVGYTSSGDYDMSLCGCDASVVRTTGDLCKDCSLGKYPLQFDDFRKSVSTLIQNPSASVLFPNFGPSVIHIATTNKASWNDYVKDPTMWYSLVSSITGSQGSQFALMGSSEEDSCPGQGGVVCSNGVSTGVNGVSFTLILDKVFGGNEVGGFLSLGILGFYVTIIYAIGQFIRVMFQDASQKVIYSEIPNPQELLDLISGVAIAQVYGDMRREFVMYNCLVKILRSPETLIAIGGADLTGYGAYRNDQPPYPDQLGPLDNRPPPVQPSQSEGAPASRGSGDGTETPEPAVESSPTSAVGLEGSKVGPQDHRVPTGVVSEGSGGRSSAESVLAINPTSGSVTEVSAPTCASGTTQLPADRAME